MEVGAHQVSMHHILAMEVAAGSKVCTRTKCDRKVSDWVCDK